MVRFKIIYPGHSVRCKIIYQGHSVRCKIIYQRHSVRIKPIYQRHSVSSHFGSGAAPEGISPASHSADEWLLAASAIGSFSVRGPLKRGGVRILLSPEWRVVTCHALLQSQLPSGWRPHLYAYLKIIDITFATLSGREAVIKICNSGFGRVPMRARPFEFIRVTDAASVYSDTNLHSP